MYINQKKDKWKSHKLYGFVTEDEGKACLDPA